MSVSVARVPTQSASRYLQQLAKHWSHKMTVVFSPEEGTIEFPNGSRVTMRAASDTLDVELAVPDDGDTARMRKVVAEHLDRFAFREAPLTFDWHDVARIVDAGRFERSRERLLHCAFEAEGSQV